VCIKVFFNIFLQIKEHFNTLPFILLSYRLSFIR